MQRSARLQLVGPVALFYAVLAAEAAAYALAQAPSSAFLWYLNLEVFSLFRKSRAALSEAGNLPFAQVLFIAGPIAAIGMVGSLLKNKLCLAISSNLSFCFAAFIALNWHSWTTATHVRAASLAFVQVSSGSTLLMIGVLAITSFFSFAASHFLYFGALRSKA
jgi:hypothetical protein